MKSDLIQLMRRLEAGVREETAAQHRALEVLMRQQQAVVANDVDAFRTGAEALHAAARSAVERANERDAVVRHLADIFGVDASTLTLRSIARRAGEEGQRLSRLREDLADNVQRVSRKTKQVFALARMHEKLFSEIIQTVLGGTVGGSSLESETPFHAGGRLVDAQV